MVNFFLFPKIKTLTDRQKEHADAYKQAHTYTHAHIHFLSVLKKSIKKTLNFTERL